MRKNKQRIFFFVLCLVLSFCSSSCSQNKVDKNDSASINLPSQYQPMPEPLLPADLESMCDALDKLESELKDALEQIESKHTYVINYDADLKYNNSVGNEWRYGVRFDDEYIASSNNIVVADSLTEIKFVVFAIELDDWNDYGATQVTFEPIEFGQKQTKRVTVIVQENNGRYTGNIAKWYFELTIERI